MGTGTVGGVTVVVKQTDTDSSVALIQAAGQRVLVVDDVLATGGTARAAVSLVERLGGTLYGLAFLIELDFLNGREKLAGERVTSILHY